MLCVARSATTASITSDVPLLASRPTYIVGSGSVIGTTSQPRSRRRSWTCDGERLAWATTGAGTTGHSGLEPYSMVRPK